MNKRSVAIVDDNMGALSSLKDICELLDCFCKVDAFIEPTKFLKKVQDGTKYDLYLLDIEMPLIGGEDLLERVRKIHEDAIIVFVSGANKHSTIGLKKGVHCLSKPVDLDELEFLIIKLNEEKAINVKHSNIKLKNVHCEGKRYIEYIVDRRDILLVSSYEDVNKSGNKNSMYLHIRDKDSTLELKNTSLVEFEKDNSLLSDKKTFLKVSDKSIINRTGVKGLLQKDLVLLEINNKPKEVTISKTELESFNKWYS